MPAQPAPVAPAVENLPRPDLLFRTSADFDPRLDLKARYVAVDQATPDWAARIRAVASWAGAGQQTLAICRIAVDPASFFTGGRADGAAHPEVLVRDRHDRSLSIGDRPAALPYGRRLSHLKEQVQKAVEAGAGGIWLSDLALPSDGGYEPLFRDAVQQVFQEAWLPPHESPLAYYRASRLRSQLQLRAVEELAVCARDAARKVERDVTVWLSARALTCRAGEGLAFPLAAALRLPVDGLVAEIQPEGLQRPVMYEGRAEPRPFEAAWQATSYLANQVEGLGGRTLLFTTPFPEIGGDSGRDPLRAYRKLLACSLTVSHVGGVEVAPWPERLYSQPDDSAGVGGTMPASLSTSLTVYGNVARAIRELAVGEAVDWEHGGRGVGVLVFDTFEWQRSAPAGALRALDGLTLPLLRRGMPVQIVPGERLREAGSLDRYRVLLLSYDEQKPPGPEAHQALAQWIRGGGHLILFGGADAYAGIPEWWNRNGFASPVDHLLRASAATVDLAQRAVRSPADRFQPADATPGIARRVIRIPLGVVEPGGPAYLRFQPADEFSEDPAWIGRVRLIDGPRVRADFRAGAPAERPFVADEAGTQVHDNGRRVPAGSYLVYRFLRLPVGAILELEVAGECGIGLARAGDPAAVLLPVVAELPRLRLPPVSPLVFYPLTGAQPLYQLQGAGPGDPSPAWRTDCGQGSLTYMGFPAALAAESPAGAELVRQLVRQACGRAGISHRDGPLIARRGAYRIAHALDRTVILKGTYLDLLHPDMPLRQDPQLPYREPVIFKEVSLTGRTPILLHATHRARLLQATTRETRVEVDGPLGTTGTLRIFPAGYQLAGAEARDSSGRSLAVEARTEGPIVRVRYPQTLNPLTLTVRWVKPEERLTK